VAVFDNLIIGDEVNLDLFKHLKKLNLRKIEKDTNF
jgi:hypothetical protein